MKEESKEESNILIPTNKITILILYFGRYKCSSAARDEVTRFCKKKVDDVVKTEDWKKAMIRPDLITELVTSVAKDGTCDCSLEKKWKF